MTLDERQTRLVKATTRELTAEVMNLPIEKRASRLELISILLADLELPELADGARHAACHYGEGEAAYRAGTTPRVNCSQP